MVFKDRCSETQAGEKSARVFRYANSARVFRYANSARVFRYAHSARVFRYAKSSSLRFSDVEGDGFKYLRTISWYLRCLRYFRVGCVGISRRSAEGGGIERRGERRRGERRGGERRGGGACALLTSKVTILSTAGSRASSFCAAASCDVV